MRSKTLKKQAKKQLNKVQKQTTDFILKVRKNTATAVLAAFAFVMALVWRDAIQQGVNKAVAVFNLPEESYLFSIIAALIVTIICILGIVVFSKWAEKK